MYNNLALTDIELFCFKKQEKLAHQGSFIRKEE
jgi:hypothetical protein